MKRSVMALLVVLCSVTTRAETRVIELHSADPGALVPVVKPMLGPWESVSVFRQSLVLNAAPETLDRISALVKELDRPLRNLWVSLRRAEHAEASGERSANVASTRSRERVQALRALESTPLLLRDGSLVPLPAGGLFGPDIQWEALEAGFALSARVSGEQVIIETQLRDDRYENGRVRYTTLQNSVSGALGEWIPLGEVHSDQRHESTQGGLGTRARDSGRYEIRVEVLP